MARLLTIVLLTACASTATQAQLQLPHPASPRPEPLTWTADNGNGTYTNPLFFDEFSDPDLIRVGADFYLTGTTMHSMPGLPILHSRDLVNWHFVAYAVDRLDLGPKFRLENGQQAYGQGIWAPSFRYHAGTFYIFSNVNGEKTQLFTARNPAGPWTRTPMKRSLHDLSVLFDDDGKAYVVWGYRGIHLAQLTKDLLDILPGTEREILAPSAGMGEGLHLYKIKGKYFLTSAWFRDEMRMPTARADRLEGPWEVNQNVSRGEDFGFAEGRRFESGGGPQVSPFRVRPGNPEAQGRNAIHQGGIVDTPKGEWWGFSMMDANSVGRLTALSPVTWSDGWPYFGLPGNLGRTPRTWVKPDTGVVEKPSAPYRRDDDFSGPRLRPIWQWNHVPVDDKWSLTERPGYLRLHALPAADLLTARNTLTQRAVGPQSTATVILETSGMKPGDRTGIALFARPYAGIGVKRTADGLVLQQFVEGEPPSRFQKSVEQARVWLRASTDFLTEQAEFRYSLDGERFLPIGEPVRMVFQLLTFQGVRYSLFDFNDASSEGGVADFDDFFVYEPNGGSFTLIPFGEELPCATTDGTRFWIRREDRLVAEPGELRAVKSMWFVVVDRGLGRVGLRNEDRFVSVDKDGRLGFDAPGGRGEAFQWIETFTGEQTLMSLTTHRYVRLDAETGALFADSPGPHPNGRDGVRWHCAPYGHK